jgi:hypothetical protein
VEFDIGERSRRARSVTQRTSLTARERMAG